MRISAVVTAVAVALASVACTTAPTKISESWRDPSYAGGPVTNIVVIGAKIDPANRRTLEDTFAATLSTHGVRVTPSYELFPEKLPSTAALRDALHAGGYDGVLVADMRGVQERATTRAGGCCSHLYDHTGTWEAPGWTGTEELVSFETTLWDPRGDGKLIWSADTQTEDPTSAKDFAESLVGMVVPALTDARLIPPAQPQPSVASASR